MAFSGLGAASPGVLSAGLFLTAVSAGTAGGVAAAGLAGAAWLTLVAAGGCFSVAGRVEGLLSVA